MSKPHISPSEFKDWAFCPFYRKLVWEDGLRDSSIHAQFGTAVHYALEKCISSGSRDKEQYKKLFLEVFEKETKDGIKENEQSLVPDMLVVGPKLVDEGLNYLDVRFPGFKVLGTEKKLLVEGLLPRDKKFKGTVDLIIEDSQGNQYVMDWKTCSFGWDIYRKSDKLTSYQLVLYKKFLIHEGIISDKANVEFLLLKRTAADGKRVESVPTTSGEKKMNNAMELLSQAINQIEIGKPVKNRLNCNACKFRKTPHCP